jgi:hypothetical protein
VKNAAGRKHGLLFPAALTGLGGIGR